MSTIAFGTTFSKARGILVRGLALIAVGVAVSSAFGAALAPETVAAAPSDDARGDGFTLTRNQLVINTRIAETASARAFALERRLRELSGGDIKDGTLTGARFGSGVELADDGVPFDSGQNQDRGSVRPPAVPFDASGVRFTPAQLLSAQRSAQDAIVFTRFLTRRMASGGSFRSGDVVDGTITALDFAGTPRVVRAEDQPQSTQTPAIPGAKRTSVTGLPLTLRQLRVNQKIAQVAIRRVNAAWALLGEGLPAEAFDEGSLTAQDLEPNFRKVS